jgi:SAM-dependent methyltransferase
MPSLSGALTALRRSRKQLSRRIRRVTRWPPVGGVDMGDLGATSPISRIWGFDRGTPVDRYYIERFLERRRDDVHGRVLEVLNNDYTVRYGGDRVDHSDVLHHEPGNPRATVVADLTLGDSIPSGTYDCIICTQTLQFIYEVAPAVSTLHRILKPGGTLLVTVPGITQISRADMDSSGDYWRFTSVAARRLLEGVFGEDTVEVEAHGNVAAAAAFLHGIAAEELQRDQLDFLDPDYEVIITVRAQKRRGRSDHGLEG